MKSSFLSTEEPQEEEGIEVIAARLIGSSTTISRNSGDGRHKRKPSCQKQNQKQNGSSLTPASRPYPPPEEDELRPLARPELPFPTQRPQSKRKTTSKYRTGQVLQPPPSTPLLSPSHPNKKPYSYKSKQQSFQKSSPKKVPDPEGLTVQIEGDPSTSWLQVVGVKITDSPAKMVKRNAEALLRSTSRKLSHGRSMNSSTRNNTSNIDPTLTGDNKDMGNDNAILDMAFTNEEQLHYHHQLHPKHLPKADIEVPSEFFHDEDDIPIPSELDLEKYEDEDNNNNNYDCSETQCIADSSRCSRYSRKEYLEKTQKLMEQRKQQQRCKERQARKETQKIKNQKQKQTIIMYLKGRQTFVMSMLVFVGLSLVIAMVVMNVSGKKSSISTSAASEVPSNRVNATATSAPDQMVYEPLSISDFPVATQNLLESDDITVPQVLAYRFLVKDPFVKSYPKWRQYQRMALATLYFSTNGQDWKNASNWLSYDLPECQWYSQACDSNGKIRRLLLSGTNLDGTLPPELFWLTDLQQVQLHDNPLLRGTIPTDIGLLTQLQVLWIQRCSLSSSSSSSSSTNTYALPTAMGRLQELLYLDVSDNPLGNAIHKDQQQNAQLTTSRGNDSGRSPSNGNIHQDLPTELGQLAKLQELILSRANLIGTLPSELGQLTVLQSSLQLEDNSLSGTLPSEIGNWKQLEHLYAGGNGFSGTLPTTIGELSALQLFDFSANHIEGTLPMHIGLCGSLQEIWLYDNLITGTIPVALSYLSSTLDILDLSMNQLSSTLPAEFGQLTQLKGLWLYQNKLTGNVPDEVGDLHAQLLQLSLFGNSLSGSIPSALNRLTELRGLWIDQNRLSGSIPSGLLESTSLIAAHLFDNHLTGPIPRSVSDNSVLQELRLETNQLNGTIAATIGLLANLQVLQLQENQLWGSLPESMSELTSLTRLSLQSNQLTGSVPWQVCQNKNTFADFLSLSVDCYQVQCNCNCQCPTS